MSNNCIVFLIILTARFQQTSKSKKCKENFKIFPFFRYIDRFIIYICSVIKFKECRQFLHNSEFASYASILPYKSMNCIYDLH